MRTKIVFFLCFLCFSFLFIGLTPFVSAQEDFEVSLEVGRSFYFVGNIAEVDVFCNVSGLSLPFIVKNASGSVVYSQNISPNVTVSLPVVLVNGFGTFEVSCGGVTSWFWVQYEGNLVSLGLPYSWSWKNVNYTLLANYTLVASAFDGVISVDWVSGVLGLFGGSPMVTYNGGVVRLHVVGAGQRALDFWFYNQFRGLTFRGNGTMQRSVSVDWKISALVGKWGLDCVCSGQSLTYSWSELRGEGVSFTLVKNESCLNVVVPQVFDIYDSIFSDGFESGNFSAWTGTGGGSSVQSVVKHHGTYAAEWVVTGNNYWYKTLVSDTDNLFVRGYFYFQSLNATGGSYSELLSICQTDTSVRAEAVLYVTGGEIYFALISGGSVFNTGIEVQTGQWYCVEVEHKRAVAGYSKLWIDGTLEETNSFDSSAQLQIRYVFCGGFFRYSVNSTANSDCVVVDSSYIGVESSSQVLSFALAQTITVTSGLIDGWVISKLLSSSVTVVGGLGVVSGIGVVLSEVLGESFLVSSSVAAVKVVGAWFFELVGHLDIRNVLWNSIPEDPFSGEDAVGVAMMIGAVAVCVGFVVPFALVRRRVLR